MMSRASSFANLLQRGQQLSRAFMARTASPAVTPTVKAAHFAGHRAALCTTARAQASADPTQKQAWTPADMPSCDGESPEPVCLPACLSPELYHCHDSFITVL